MIRSETTSRSAAVVEDARVGDDPNLVPVGVDVPADHTEVGGAARDRLDRLVAAELQAMRDQVGEELFVALLVLAIRSD